MIEKIKSSISLKISFLSLIACVIVSIVNVITEFYILGLVLMIFVFLFIMGILHFFTGLLWDVVKYKSNLVKSIVIISYLSIAIWLIYILLSLTFVVEYTTIILLIDLIWKLLICADAICVFVSIAKLIFGKKENGDNITKNTKE